MPDMNSLTLSFIGQSILSAHSVSGTVFCAKNKMMNKPRPRLRCHGQTSLVPNRGDRQGERQFQCVARKCSDTGAIYSSWWLNSQSWVLLIFSDIGPIWSLFSLLDSADIWSSESPTSRLIPIVNGGRWKDGRSITLGPPSEGTKIELYSPDLELGDLVITPELLLNELPYCKHFHQRSQRL